MTQQLGGNVTEDAQHYTLKDLALRVVMLEIHVKDLWQAMRGTDADQDTREMLEEAFSFTSRADRDRTQTMDREAQE